MSYNTVDEANLYVTSNYTSTDSLRVSWEELSTEDRQVLLNRAYSIINSLPLRGCKASVDQPGAFPRYGSKEVPQQVKYAEVELAVSFTDTEQLSSLAEYKSKADYGISSYRLGNFSETLLSYAKDSLQLKYGLISTAAERLLTPWMSGGFCIE